MGRPIDRVQEGMLVFDRSNEEIGKVCEVYLGSPTAVTAEERHGFIRIDTAGAFAADRYATADQIAAVDDSDVRLNVQRDDLLKR